MQTDMHYYGTYAMARCAGVEKDVARAIATAAEYVDDSDYEMTKLADGSVLISEPTAHHPKNLANLRTFDQRRTWVPFHFIPGGEGAGDDRLVCRMDSGLAQAMVKRNVGLAMEPFGLQLVGITAHVYADTFAHYGFCGVSSPVNHVEIGSIEFDAQATEEERLREGQKSFEERFIDGPIADVLSRLGHAGGATFPDQPYLRWRFKYAGAAAPVAWRDNPTTFLLACRKLHEMFSTFIEVSGGQYAEEGASRKFDDAESVVTQILASRDQWEGRAKAWSDAVAEGKLFPNPDHEPIPKYDPGRYMSDLSKLDKMTADDARKTAVYKFLQAANNHRDYVLSDLLKQKGIDFHVTLEDWVRDKFAGALAWFQGNEKVIP